MFAQVLAAKMDLNRKAGNVGIHCTFRPQSKLGLFTT